MTGPASHLSGAPREAGRVALPAELQEMLLPFLLGAYAQVSCSL